MEEKIKEYFSKINFFILDSITTYPIAAITPLLVSSFKHQSVGLSYCTQILLPCKYPKSSCEPEFDQH